MTTATRPRPRERAPRRKPDHPVTAYARAVDSGKITAGRMVRLACRRHLDDLERQEERGFVWRPEKADHAIEFFRDVLRLVDDIGPNAPSEDDSGRPFILEPWQVFIVGSLFGWYLTDGTRRFRVAYIEVAKGNGKTPIAAGIGLYGLVADGERAAEIYPAAVTREQAKIAFVDAKNMVSVSAPLRRHLVVRENNISNPTTRSYFRPVSSEHRGLDGKRPHIAIIDEEHEHPNELVYEKMRAGTKGRRNPLIFIITNSGYDKQSVCWHHHEYSEKVLSGAVENDSWFAYVAQLDTCEGCEAQGYLMANPACPDCDSWRDESTWIKANPNLGVSVTEKYLREQVAEAEGMPSKQNIVLRLNFCVWTEQAMRWLDMQVWGRNARPVDHEALRGKPCWAGLDLASTQDICALVLVFKPDDDHPRWRLLPLFWVPEEAMWERSRRDGVPYDLWVRDGYMTATPGNVTDYDFIRADITGAEGLMRWYNIRELAVDRWNSTQLQTQLQGDGVTVVQYGQGFASMTAPAKEFERLLREGSIDHGDNPVLNWMAANVAIEQDSAGNIKPSKRKSTERIDGIPATLMGLGRAMVASDQPEGISVYVAGED